MSICNEMFEGWDLGRICQYCAGMGYSGIEIAPFTLGEKPLEVSTARRKEIRETISGHGMSCVGLHWLLAKTTGFHLTTNDGAIRKQTAQYLSDLVELCRDLGGSVMVFGSPQQRSRLPDVSPDQAWTNALEVFRNTIPVLEKHNVTLVLEPLGPEETNFLNTAEEVVRMIEKIGSENIRLLLDVKAMSTESITIPEIIGRNHQHLVHFHANDPNRLGPGMGDMDFRPIMQALRDCKYDGWVSVEVFDFRPGPELIASRSIECLKKSLA